MFTERILESEGSKSALLDAISTLTSINAFAALLEIGAQKNIPLPSGNPLETAALRGAWHDGWVACIDELYNFIHHNESIEKRLPTMDFNAAHTLFTTGQIDGEQYERLTGKKPE